MTNRDRAEAFQDKLCVDLEVKFLKKDQITFIEQALDEAEKRGKDSCNHTCEICENAEAEYCAGCINPHSFKKGIAEGMERAARIAEGNQMPLAQALAITIRKAAASGSSAKELG